MPAYSAVAESLTETLTVYEQLLYTSELKNPQKERLGRKIDRVEQVLQQLALVDCKDLRIGSSLKTSISGETPLEKPFG